MSGTRPGRPMKTCHGRRVAGGAPAAGRTPLQLGEGTVRLLWQWQQRRADRACTRHRPIRPAIGESEAHRGRGRAPAQSSQTRRHGAQRAVRGRGRGSLPWRRCAPSCCWPSRPASRSARGAPRRTSSCGSWCARPSVTR